MNQFIRDFETFYDDFIRLNRLDNSGLMSLSLANIKIMIHVITRLVFAKKFIKIFFPIKNNPLFLNEHAFIMYMIYLET